jgi:hypothetical protein
MKHFYTFLLFLLSSTVFAQAPMVKTTGWSARAGSVINFPLIGDYYDFSLVKGADYFWEYKADPKAGIGYYAELAKTRNLNSRRAMGFITYGIGYKQTVRSLKYSGWEGGGNSGVYNTGAGSMRWNDHYLTLSGKITHQFYVGMKKRVVLNSLGFSAGFKFYEQEKRDYTGSSTYRDGTVIMDALGYNDKGINDEFYIPQMHLNYDFGYVIPLKKALVIPNIIVPILNLNNYLHRYQPTNQPLMVRKEYYKEVMVGIVVMPVK